MNKSNFQTVMFAIIFVTMNGHTYKLFKNIGLILIQTVWHSDAISDRFKLIQKVAYMKVCEISQHANRSTVRPKPDMGINHVPFQNG